MFTSFFGTPTRYQAQRGHNPDENQQESVPALKVRGGERGCGKNCTNNYVIFLVAKGHRTDTERCGHSGENVLFSFPQSSPTSRKKGPAGRDYQMSEIIHLPKKKNPICCRRSQRDVTLPAKQRELTRSTAAFINVPKSRQHRVPYKMVCL